MPGTYIDITAADGGKFRGYLCLPPSGKGAAAGMERRELWGDSPPFATKNARPGRPVLPRRGIRRQIFGNVTPCCPWYLPPRSL